jgi:CHAT domain-containing protein
MSGELGLRPIGTGANARRVVASLARIGRYIVALLAITAATLLHHERDPLEQLRVSGRNFEARLTAFDYSPLRVRRGGNSSDEVQNSDVFGVLARKVADARTPENIHRLALAHLAAGEVASGYRLLQEADRLHPNQPEILSDLAAAEMALDQVADAAEHSATALENDPHALSAAFNWALALERLSNRPAAIEAWENYLQRDFDSRWADEARQHLAQLRIPRGGWDKDQRFFKAGVGAETLARLLQQYPGHVRSWTQNSALLIWIRQGNPEQLALLRSVAQYFARHGDPFLSDVVEHAVAHREEVTAALAPYTAARMDERESRSGDAVAHYSEAAEALRRIGSPLAVAASIFSAKASYGEEHYDVALAKLDEVEAQLAAKGNLYAAMSSEAAWLRALILGRTGRLQESLDSFQRAEAFAMRAGETENVVDIRTQFATLFEMLGDRAEADRYRMDVLRQCEESNADADRMAIAYAETSMCALRAGRPRLALAFADAQKTIGRQLKNPFYRAQGDAWRALTLLELGRTAEASASVEAALREARQVTTPDWRLSLTADCDFIAGRIAQAEGQLNRASASYSSAIDTWTNKQWHLHMATGLVTRGNAYLAAGDRAGAEADFSAAITEMEGQRANLGEPLMRVAYFERAERAFEQLIELLIDDGRTVEALSVAEKKRARSLLDQIAAGGSDSATPFDGPALAAAVHGRTVILEITLLDRGAELWAIQEGRLDHARSTATGKAIEQAVSRHLAAVAGDDEAATQREGRWLFDQLIAPIAAQLPADAELVIVPDGTVQALPFATLVTPDGTFLIDKYTMTTAPSASVFLRSPSKSRGDSLLAVAQPAPQDFEPLPAAASEVRSIARQYPHGRVVIGEQITPSEFLDAASAVSLVHFAGHAATDQRRSSQSALQFESSSGPALQLTAKEIGQSRLRAHPLVVLAACGTGRGAVRRNEGVDSLATAFLQAGARGVVATLWDVGDTMSARLFRSFHQNLRRGARAADALRDTQRSLLHSSDPNERRPSTWGSAIVVGTF